MSTKTQPIDDFARRLDPGVRESVHEGAVFGVTSRQALFRDFPNPNALRRLAGAIKQHTLEHLDTYLEQAEAALQKNGAQVHFAVDAASASALILDLLRSRGATKIVKSKSMAAEEIHLNAFLAENGCEVLETDLGEFIVQLDGDEPSHVVKPIIHKNRRDVARTFEHHGLGAYNDDPETITRRARAFMRQRYMASQAGITGGNFLVAESGRLVVVTNEGNCRFGLAPNKLHIALVGIEKIIPSDRDLGVFLNLLARSATGQQLTVYTEFMRGPKAPGQPSGPEEMHVVLLDNGRSNVLGTNSRDILRCIRCGACQNVCPVYRQASGHAYRATYGGPIGAVLTPLFAGKEFPKFADLPKASSLCGACQEVCPVDIPIPDLLVRLRDRAKIEHVPSPGTPPMGGFAALATSPRLWRAAMSASKMMNHLPASLAPVKPLHDWLQQRTLPEWRGGKFRKWMRDRKNRNDEAGMTNSRMNDE